MNVTILKRDPLGASTVKVTLKGENGEIAILKISSKEADFLFNNLQIDDGIFSAALEETKKKYESEISRKNAVKKENTIDLYNQVKKTKECRAKYDLDDDNSIDYDAYFLSLVDEDAGTFNSHFDKETAKELLANKSLNK